MTTWEIIKAVLLFLLGFACLIKGGDWFVDGASGIAKRLHIPEIIIGATVVSIGTTLPEVMVSSSAAVKGSGDIAYGNALGSIICNTSLIAALTMAIRPSKTERKNLILPVCFFFGAMLFYAFNAYAFGAFSRISGIVLLLIFAAYTAVIIVTQMKAQKQAAAVAGEPLTAPEPEKEAQPKEKQLPLWKEIVFLIVGAALIALGANLLVDNGTILAKIMGVPESVIALTFVALGTSLPELVTAITSLIKGHSALSLGNIIGANLFNLVLVSGLSTTLSPYQIPAGKTVFGMNASLVVDIPLCFLVMLILTLPALKRQKVSRVQGIVLLAIYVSYTIFQFVL